MSERAARDHHEYAIGFFRYVQRGGYSRTACRDLLAGMWRSDPERYAAVRDLIEERGQ